MSRFFNAVKKNFSIYLIREKNSVSEAASLGLCLESSEVKGTKRPRNECSLAQN